MINYIGTKPINTDSLILRRFVYTDIDSLLRDWIEDKQTQCDYGEPYYPTDDDVH